MSNLTVSCIFKRLKLNLVHLGGEARAIFENVYCSKQICECLGNVQVYFNSFSELFLNITLQIIKVFSNLHVPLIYSFFFHFSNVDSTHLGTQKLVGE